MIPDKVRDKCLSLGLFLRFFRGVFITNSLVWQAN